MVSKALLEEVKSKAVLRLDVVISKVLLRLKCIVYHAQVRGST